MGLFTHVITYVSTCATMW